MVQRKDGQCACVNKPLTRDILRHHIAGKFATKVSGIPIYLINAKTYPSCGYGGHNGYLATVDIMGILLVYF